MAQDKQSEWAEQWTLFQDQEYSLFEEWIYPVTIDDFNGKTVLECGCGGGQHTAFVAPRAKSVTAVDLNTVEIARQRNSAFPNVRFVEADLAVMDLQETYDIVFCIGVIHHTQDPDKTFANIYRHCRPGGTVLVWTYSAEGNGLVRFVVEPLRRLVFKWIPRKFLVSISLVITACLYPIVFTLYRIPKMTFLPYSAYFSKFRQLSFQRNVLNVFDKLNAPQTRFTTERKAREWFNESRFEKESLCIRRHLGVSYTLVGTKR